MTDHLPVGPYRTIELPDGATAPWYVIPFDKRGRCEGPRTRAELVGAITSEVTDIFVFSHGWNNDWEAATKRYDHFFNGFVGLRRERALSYGRPFRPVLVGIFWPSTALVLPWEEAPDIAAPAADADTRADAAVGQERREIQTLAEEVDDANVERFYDLSQRTDGLDEAEALELARMLAPVYAAGDDEVPTDDPPPTPDELVALWRRLPSGAASTTPTEYGRRRRVAASGPRAAGILDKLDPRVLVRAATVWPMKDRAGTVGARGVGPLLIDLLNAGPKTARVHLIGHSYGAKVVLSATSAEPLPRRVNSALLLQPAISYLCFAKDANKGEAGGFRPALERVEQPIMTTFSEHDRELTRLFHLAVRRSSDAGELRIAGRVPPNKYAALGGYGPGGCDGACQEVQIKAAGDAYDLSGLQGAGVEVLALNADDAIKGHGAISVEPTWWALFSQVVGPPPA